MNFFLLLKFTIIGIIGVAINFLITWLLKDILKFNKYLSNSLGYGIAMFFNFFGNRTWTYSAVDELLFYQFLKFLIVVFVGVSLNHIIVFYFHSLRKTNFYVSKIIAVVIVFFWNFTMHTFFTFDYLSLINSLQS
tara:strand:+ start:1608 stop:2012 length:405 start_codon:yes stop_codon:yes gene_type:complete